MISAVRRATRSVYIRPTVRHRLTPYQSNPQAIAEAKQRNAKLMHEHRVIINAHNKIIAPKLQDELRIHSDATYPIVPYYYNANQIAGIIGLAELPLILTILLF